MKRLIDAEWQHSFQFSMTMLSILPELSFAVFKNPAIIDIKLHVGQFLRSLTKSGYFSSVWPSFNFIQKSVRAAISTIGQDIKV